MSSPSLPPGFRFHPTDEELILYYLRNRAASLPCPVSIIAEVDIYKFNPWDLPGKAKFGDREWYFFSPRDRKYPNGVRPNRAAASGYWKATGTDKPILSGSENLGVKKALVFYRGKPPKGQKTNWIMHEYRLAETKDGSKRPLRLGDSSMRLDDWVLCRIYQKSNHLHSMAPLADQEQEDSGTEDLYFPSLPNILQQQQEQQQLQQQQQDSLRIQKSSSLLKLVEDSDYSVLSQLLDNPSNFLGLEHDSLVVHRNLNQAYNNNNSNGVGYSIQHSPVPEIPVSIAESSLKRLKTVNGYSEVATDPLHAQKNLSSHMPANLTSQFGGHLHNMLN